MTKIITFANSSYALIIKKWLKYISYLGLIDNVLIIALDNNVKKYIVDYKLEIITDPFDIAKEGIEKFWEFRCVKFIEIYKRYGTFIHSDLDAIWLKNPFNYLSLYKYDLIFRCRFDSLYIHPLKIYDLEKMRKKNVLYNINFGRAYFP